ncbi:uncharacterized protein LOC121467066 [Drosophila elegans]|uniref:uncharacterized protein LOC121467066 n=1 Tax=Drosophila elegans TaxID=30023 RepID=UPI001BC83C55|nr:uncharacterized protein LOC121467066 [Drosophila elegans]
MDEVIVLSDDSNDTEVFHMETSHHDGGDEAMEREFLTSDGETDGSSVETDDCSQAPEGSRFAGLRGGLWSPRPGGSRQYHHPTSPQSAPYRLEDDEDDASDRDSEMFSRPPRSRESSPGGSSGYPNGRRPGEPYYTESRRPTSEEEYPWTRRDPRSGHPGYPRPSPPRFPDVEHSYHHTSEDQVCRYAGHVSFMRIDVRSVVVKVPGLPAEGPYVDEPPSPPLPPALENNRAMDPDVDVEKAVGERIGQPRTPPRRTVVPTVSVSLGVQTSPVVERVKEAKTSSQSTQTSPANQDRVQEVEPVQEAGLPEPRVITSDSPDPVYLAGFELISDSEDDEGERPLFRRCFQTSPQQDPRDVDTSARPRSDYPYRGDAGQRWDGAVDPQHFPSCAHPIDQLTEWEDRLLDQVLMDISEIDSTESAARDTPPNATTTDGVEAVSNSALELTEPAGREDDLCPLPEGWIGGSGLRYLPRRIVQEIQRKVATRAGRGRRVRIAIGGDGLRFIVTIKSDGRLFIAPREERGGCNVHT